jgi:hypothetical protein
VPDHAGSHGDEESGVTRLAAEFVQAVGWPEMPSLVVATAGTDVAATGGTGGSLPLEGLVHALGNQRQEDVGWWRVVAEAWLSLGQPNLAERCASRARELTARGSAADWADLEALARVSMSARSEMALPDTETVDTWTIQGRDPAARRKRLGAAFGGRSSDGDAELSLGEVSDYLRAKMLGARGGFSAELAAGFYQAGEYRLVVEQFLAMIAGKDLMDWRSNCREELLWCGRSLLRLGDRASAYACFAIAVGSDAVAVDTRDETKPDPDPAGTEATKYVAMLREDTAFAPGTDEFRVFPDGVRLAHWLAVQRMEGIFPDFAERIRTGPLRRSPGVFVRQFSRMGHQSGWFPPLGTQLAEQSRSYRLERITAGLAPPAVLALPPGVTRGKPRRPRSGRGRTSRIRSRVGWRAPAPFISTPGAEEAGPGGRHPSAVSIPIGIKTSGGQVTVDIEPGSRMMLIGPPFDAAMLAIVGEHACAAGWSTVLVTRQGRAREGDCPGWVRLGSAQSARSTGAQWLPVLAISPTLRAAVRSCLSALLPECTDPAASACLDRIVNSLADAQVNDVFFTEDRNAVIEFASTVVARASGIRYDTLSDLRRAALLIDYVRAAIAALADALASQWREDGRAGQSHATAVCLELPADNELAAALRLTVLMGALLEASADTDQATGQDQQREATARFESTTLKVKLRGDAIDEEVKRAASEAAEHTPVRSAAESAPPAARSDSNPWVSHGVIPLSGSAQVCLLIDADAELAKRVLDEWLDGCAGHYSLMVAARDAAAKTLAACSDYPDLLIGSLEKSQLTLCEIATGVSLRCLDGNELSDRGAIRVRPGERCDVADRLVIWPVHLNGWERG